MIAILSNFGLAAIMSTVVVIATGLASAIALARARAGGRSGIQPAARVVAVGAALLILAATAAPYSWPPERYGPGDLVLEIGRGGLRDLARVLASPASLASLLAVANIALYVPLTFAAAIGWPARAGSILAAALVLSLAVESWQFIALERVAATDDLILNMSGAVIGLFLGLVVRRGRLTRGA